MIEMAAEVDMPAHFVELRHQAVHHELPGLIPLRGVVKDALRWLWDKFWVKLDEMEDLAKKPSITPPALMASLNAALRTYRNERLAEVTSSGFSASQDNNGPARSTCRTIVQLCREERVHLELLTRLLLEGKADDDATWRKLRLVLPDRQSVLPLDLTSEWH